MSEREQPPEHISIDQQAMAAGRTTPGHDPIAELEDHAKRVIEGASLSQHHRMMALPKLAELIFWIRAGTGKG